MAISCQLASSTMEIASGAANTNSKNKAAWFSVCQAPHSLVSLARLVMIRRRLSGGISGTDRAGAGAILGFASGAAPHCRQS